MSRRSSRLFMAIALVGVLVVIAIITLTGHR
jgi:hypothetical protein